MVVCLCHGITHREMREARKPGAMTPDEMARICRAGTGCGACREALLEILGAMPLSLRMRHGCMRERPFCEAVGSVACMENSSGRSKE
jgi:bacterioferritin-associated ferredoxin